MSGNGYTVLAALILVIPQFIAIWQNRRIEEKVHTVGDKVETVVAKVVKVEESVNGVLEARIAVSERAAAAEGKAEGLEQGRTENKEKK